jgi:SAM-dependent methyltransferase
MALTEEQDATGLAMLDFLEGQEVHEIAERDDGMIAPSGGPAAYFSEYADWSASSKEALAHANGRVLDVGCGAGRVSIHLQGQGHEVVGVDVSPGAVEVAGRRGVEDVRLLSVTELGPGLGVFDTLVMAGNNFGLFGGEKRARWLLRRFRRITAPDGRIIAETLDPYQTEDPDNLAYHQRNRERGRMGGQVRLRVRYKTRRSPWFDYLLVSEEELNSLLTGTGWRLAKTFKDEGPVYWVILEKDVP